jgi:hypothetical protein
MLYDLAGMTVAAAPGTGAITLGAAAVISGISRLTFAQAGVPNGATVSYSLLDSGNGGCEAGRGVYNGTTLTRAAITASSNGGNAINASSSSLVFITALAEDITNRTRAVTVSTTDTVLASDQIVTYNRTASPAAGNINLPAVSTFLGPELILVDIAGNAFTYPLSLVPNGTDSVSGYTASSNPLLKINSNYGGIKIKPVEPRATSGAWYISP